MEFNTNACTNVGVKFERREPPARSARTHRNCMRQANNAKHFKQHWHGDHQQNFHVL